MGQAAASSNITRSAEKALGLFQGRGVNNQPVSTLPEGRESRVVGPSQTG